MNHSGQIQSLETRRLFAISTFKATQGDDIISFGMTSTGYSITINGEKHDLVAGVNDPDKAIYLDCQAGNDKVTVDSKYAYKIICYLGPGNDSYTGSDSTKARETIYGDSGNDTILGNGGSDAIYAGAGKDSVNGGAGEDLIVGDSGSDVFYGSGPGKNAGNDTLIGSTGNDTIDGGAGNDLVDGRDGADILSGNLGNDTVLGGAGNDHFYVSANINSMAGNDGGTDVLDAGANSDRIELYCNKAVTVSTDGIANDGLKSNPTFQVLNFEQFTIVAAGGSVLDAGKSPVAITADIHASFGSPADTTTPDTIIGSAFADSINNPGYNTYTNTIPQNISGGAGNDSLWGAAGSDTILGGVGNDTIYGFDANDHLEGNAGNDSIDGGGGKDTIYGNKGVDTLFGASGDDWIYGGPDDADHITGGSGYDRAASDDKDTFVTIETLLTV